MSPSYAYPNNHITLVCLTCWNGGVTSITHNWVFMNFAEFTEFSDKTNEDKAKRIFDPAVLLRRHHVTYVIYVERIFKLTLIQE